MTLSVDTLTKNYGHFRALDSVSFTLQQGVYALLGPNGAGKTTLMNLITQNLFADEGTISCDGQPITKPNETYRSRLGYMPQQQQLLNSFTTERFLYYIAALKCIKDAEAQIEHLLNLCNLTEQRQKKLTALSGGMKQRVLLAQALLGDPELIILDEPTAGLDPKERIRIRNIISQVGIDRTVLFATHVVSDIEYIAREVLFLRRGTLVEQGTVETLLRGMEGRVWEWRVPFEEADRILAEYRVSNLLREESGVHLRLVTDSPPDGATAVSSGLEELYLWLYGDDA
jgi:ABC-type multidrug transport system ATPase subunit